MVSRFLIALALLAAAPAFALAPDGGLILNGARNLDVAAGWTLFKRPWISQPSSLSAGGGVGPLFGARSCISCHVGGGPGRVAEDAIGDGMIVRVGDDPVYGRQIQTRALPGFEPEADVAFHWEAQKTLRAPKLDFAKLYYGPLTASAGLRRAPSLFGIGVLENVPESEILKGHGRPSWTSDTHVLGRFGWKAQMPTVTSQVETAFQRDFGISASGLPGPWGECTAAEKACRDAPGPGVELPDSFRDHIVSYLRSLLPPAGPDEAKPGFAYFKQAGCLSCHAVLKDAQGRKVRAYTDMLLHDMGPGLDDGIAEGAAKSSDWRTAPLWSLADELGQGGLLHDGRARSIAEAVNWHSGEASQARAAFNALSSSRRKLIESFLLGK
ncbi:MAG TPA: di-heme oxidoredictase family protein [Rhizomicrobium sp.]|nr:di-heme oxidoredictase family protein [Rhizomicrobium sp.]